MISTAVWITVQLLTGTERIEVPDWDNAVKFQLVASQDAARPGDSFELAVVADIEPGYHLYGPAEMEPSRTKVALVGESLSAGDVVYPEALRRDLSGLGEYDLYEGTIAIRIPVTLPKKHTGDVDASVKVAYQICTDHACSAPASDVLSLKMIGGQPGSPVRALHSAIFSKK